MTAPSRPPRVIRLTDVQAIDVAGGLYQPIRRELGVRAFGVNAYTALNAGDQLIELHDETGSGSGHQEELYIVMSGRATFTLDGEETDAPAGTLVFVPDVSTRREAVAVEPGTTALVVGGPADRPLPVSPFEFWYVAEAASVAGDYARAIDIISEGFEHWPDHPRIHYHLSCYHALAGNRNAALDHLASACKGDARLKGWALEDEDFRSVRETPEFARITGS